MMQAIRLLPPILRHGITLMWCSAFVAVYVLLDWASYFSPLLHLNVTPWNPAPALGLLFIIRRGRIAVAATFVAIVAGEIFVRDIPQRLALTLWLGGVLAFGYSVIAKMLRYYFPDGGLFSDKKGLLVWSAIVIFGALGNSLVFISQLLVTGLLSASDWMDAVIRFWVGDGVGIFVIFPLFWYLQDAPRRALFRAAIFKWETLAYSSVTLLSLWIAFVPGAEAGFRYFYVLFLPLVWAASRYGLVGAIFCATTLQIGMLLGGLLQHTPDVSLFELQMRAFLLALVGFLMGTTVDEQRRSAAELRHSLRLVAAGEMAGALAHELNQPLTALSAYGSACEQLMTKGGDESRLRDVVRKMIFEAGRAAAVVRRLRDFFRTGATQLEPIFLPDLIETVAAAFRDKALQFGTQFSIEEIPQVTINADQLQLEVVLRNLLANALEAVADLGGKSKWIGLRAEVEGRSRVVIEVTDSGAGLPLSLIDQAFEPFISTKSSGLGLGLAISRAIAEAHGGTLNTYQNGGGCFRLTLPLEAREQSSWTIR